MPDPQRHGSHPDIANRLKRAEGHLRSIIAMIENQRACRDIAQQMHAVEKAVAQAKKILIQDHIDHCLDQALTGAPGERRRSLEDFKAIAKYL